jgi:hypothetical protein
MGFCRRGGSKVKKAVTFAVFFIFNALSLFAYDFGVVFIQDADISVPVSGTEKTVYDIQGALIPRFTALIGETGDLYLSAAVNYEADPLEVIPELTRADFAFSAGSADIRIGRMFYSDPLGIIADGLFDGVRVSFITSAGNFHAGAWYTGFLYRERAAITMTFDELESSYVKVDYNDFANTYFAPPRILAALEYDHPSLAGSIGLKASIIAQFDAGNGEETLNSQYVTAALSVPFKSLIFNLGGCLELIQYDGKITPAFAGEAGITWLLPSSLEKHLKLSGRYSSGVSEDESIGAFLPLTTIPQGEVVEAKFSGLTLLSLDFTGRLAKSLSANMAFTYFIRNDLGTYKYYPADSSGLEGFFLGAELFGRIIWVISTGVRLNCGTGVFLPSLGDAKPDAGILWRTKLNLTVSIF